MLPEVPNRDDWFSEDHGFPRPAWPAIAGWMRVYVKETDTHEAWKSFVRHWLGRLRETLGGNYAVAESANFHLLSDLDRTGQEAHLKFLERTRARILATLGDLAEPKNSGNHVVLRLAEDDDYYTYLSHYFPEGNHATSGGVLLSRAGYVHIAYRAFDSGVDQPLLTHELTHDLLNHLPLPSWLNELLAMLFEGEHARNGPPLMDGDLAERHHDFWNGSRIQQFWQGDLFWDVEGQALAYELTRVLLVLIQTDLRPSPKDFRRFVLRADWSDAGAIATKEHLGIELGDLAGRFLGPGNWAPSGQLWQKDPVPAAG